MYFLDNKPAHLNTGLHKRKEQNKKKKSYNTHMNQNSYQNVATFF